MKGSPVSDDGDGGDAKEDDGSEGQQQNEGEVLLEKG